jgi:hypothetical protein
MNTKPLTLSKYLRRRSREICRENGCTEDEHNCESHAHIAAHGSLIDVCAPGFFQGSPYPVATLPLPWTGTQKGLEAEILDQVYEQVRDEGAASARLRECEHCPYRGPVARVWKEGFREEKARQKNKE